MARDFRPKDKKKPASSKPQGNDLKPSSYKTSSAPSSLHVSKPPAPPPFKANKTQTTTTPKKKNAKAFDSDEDSADEATLLREIHSLGGTRDDLELISSKSKPKGTIKIDDAQVSSEVASLLKQLQKDPKGPLPKIASLGKNDLNKKEVKSNKNNSPKVPQSNEKPSQSKQQKPEATKPSSKESKRQNTDVSAKESKRQSTDASSKGSKRPATDSFSKSQQPANAKKPIQDGTAKGKKVVFDDNGVGKISTSTRPFRPSALRSEPTPNWISQTLPSLPTVDKKQESPLSTERIHQLLELGTEFLEAENRAYDQLTRSEASLSNIGGSIGTLTSSDAKFVRSLLSSDKGGTLSDRISAMTLLVQSSPVHNLKSLDSLLTMSRKKSREEAGRATRALADWLASGGGLGSSRKLFYFRDQPLLSAASLALTTPDPAVQEAARSHLLLWAFEDHLKKAYFSFLQILELQSHDTIAFVRKQAVSQIFVLLRDKPEQEQNLLRLLVNKIGDPERSVASKASNHLLELLSVHPAIKFIVVKEIANLVLRPPTPMMTNNDNKDSTSDVQTNHNTHARYYGVLTLNQTILTAKDTETANHLILLYFDLFEGILKESDTRTGGKEEENPDQDDQDPESKKSTDKGRWRDRKGKAKGKGKIQEPKVVKDAHSKMMAAILAGVRRAFPFAKLDSSVFEKHVNTLFRITHSGTFNICIQALQLIFQITNGHSDSDSLSVLSTTAITDRFYRVLYDSLLDSRLETSSKQAMYLNLVFQALKTDIEIDRVKAFIKRMCQILSFHQPGFICGCLHLLGQLFIRQPGLGGMLTEPEEQEDGKEHFQDVQQSDSEDLSENKPALQQSVDQSYQGRNRDPRFANAGHTCLWDLVPLVHHFHPSVSLHATQLLQSNKVTVNADLTLHSLSHFVDRFVYRNPKQKSSTRGVSIMQPTLGVAPTTESVTRSRTHGLVEADYVNSDKFWKKNVESVPADQLFFHKFFNLKANNNKKTADSKVVKTGSDVEEDEDQDDDKEAIEEGNDDDNDSSDQDEDEKEIWKAMKQTMPGREDLQGLDDSEDDDDDEQFDYQDSDEEDDGPVVLEGMDLEQDLQDDDESEGGDIFEEDEDDLVPFSNFDNTTATLSGKRSREMMEGEEDEKKKEQEEGQDEKKSKRSKRKMVKNLPVFASADDYAHLLDSDDDGDI